HSLFTPPAPPSISTLSLHDALPILQREHPLEDLDRPLALLLERLLGGRVLVHLDEVLDLELPLLEPLEQTLDLALRGFGAEQRRSEEHTSELQSRFDLVCRLLLEKK